MAEQPTFLLVGDFKDEITDIGALCARFGWTAKTVKALADGRAADPERVVAGMVDSSSDIGQLKAAIRNHPNAFWIACCRFGSYVEQWDLESMGAFHLVHRPFDATELMQSLGFVDAALSRREKRLVPIRAGKEQGHAAA